MYKMCEQVGLEERETGGTEMCGGPVGNRESKTMRVWKTVRPRGMAMTPSALRTFVSCILLRFLEKCRRKK